jgi:hypothetical protein
MIQRQLYPNLPTQPNLTLPNLLCQTQKYGKNKKKICLKMCSLLQFFPDKMAPFLHLCMCCLQSIFDKDQIDSKNYLLYLYSHKQHIVSL